MSANKTSTTRAKLITAAKIVFARLGYENTLMRDIIVESNLSPGTFYNYFTDKHAVMHIVVNNLAEEVATYLSKAIAGDLDVKTLFTKFLKSFFEAFTLNEVNLQFLAKNQAYFRAVYFENHHIITALKASKAYLNNFYGSGYLNDNIKWLTYAMLGSCTEFLIQIANKQTKYDIDYLVGFLVNIYIDGLQNTIDKNYYSDADNNSDLIIEEATLML